MAANPRVLIIAHDQGIRQLLHDILSEHFAVTTAEDALAGTDSLLGDPYDLVILEDSLPVLPGREYMELLEASPEFQTLPVVIISTALELERKARSRPNWGFLPMPFALGQLFAQIRHLLQPRTAEIGDAGFAIMQAAE